MTWRRNCISGFSIMATAYVCDIFEAFVSDWEVGRGINHVDTTPTGHTVRVKDPFTAMRQETNDLVSGARKKKRKKKERPTTALNFPPEHSGGQ